MAKENEDKTRAALRAGIMRFATGCTEAEADEVLDVICKGWGFDIHKLAAVLPALVVPGLSTYAVAFWLHATVLLGQSQNGNELLFVAGIRAAVRCGVSAELLAKLRQHVAPAAGGEPSH